MYFVAAAMLLAFGCDVDDVVTGEVFYSFGSPTCVAGARKVENHKLSVIRIVW